MKKSAFLFIFFILFIIFTIPFKASAKSISTFQDDSSQYILYEVKKGDTLYRISKNHNVSLEELRKLNNLFNNKLHIGQILKIPKQSKIEKKSAGIYTVKKGDTLYSIAKRFGLSVEDLKEVNKLKDSKISIGQKIIIPETSKSIESEYKGEEPFILYEVKEGETLYTISLRYNVSIDLLKNLNHLEDNIILAGQKIKIPYNPFKTNTFSFKNPAVYFEQKRGEPLSEKLTTNFLSKFAISEKEENLLQKKFLEISQQYKDYKYKFGGNGNGYLDCSMFVKLVYERLGIQLPRTSYEQFLVGIPVEKEELIPGDLLFFSRNGERISHVGIYIGENKFIHFSSSRKGFGIDSLDEPYFYSKFVGAKRVISRDILKNLYNLKENL